jgi:hypothetical protein
MKTLHLTLTKKWFDSHLEDKSEDYREITPYWVQRLIQMRSGDLINTEDAHDVARDLKAGIKIYGIEPREYDIAEARNGYSANSPAFRKRFITTKVGIGNPAWGAPSYPVFIIELGEIIGTKNINRPRA